MSSRGELHKASCIQVPDGVFPRYKRRNTFRDHFLPLLRSDNRVSTPPHISLTAIDVRQRYCRELSHDHPCWSEYPCWALLLQSRCKWIEHLDLCWRFPVDHSVRWPPRKLPRRKHFPSCLKADVKVLIGCTSRWLRQGTQILPASGYTLCLCSTRAMAWGCRGRATDREISDVPGGFSMCLALVEHSPIPVFA